MLQISQTRGKHTIDELPCVERHHRTSLPPGLFIANPSKSWRCRTLFISSAGLENAKRLITRYKNGEIRAMTPELWQAKKIVDSTLHPGTSVFFQLRSSCCCLLGRSDEA
jgi:hypothetical protein